MNVRSVTGAFFVALIGAGLLVSCAARPNFAVSNLPADLRESAACISGILLATPGITAVQISARPDQRDASLGDIPPGDERKAAIAVVSYTFVDEKNVERTVSFGIFKDPRLGVPGIAYDFALASGFGVSSSGGPVTSAVESKFENLCRAEGFLRT